LTRGDLIAGVVRDYRGGRRAWGAARADGGAEAFHEWRKQVQHHWHHMRLLRNLWPEAMQAREDAAKRLSDLLGRDHDLACLADALGRDGIDASAKRRRAMLGLIGERQNVSRGEASLLASRLYVERPGPFA